MPINLSVAEVLQKSGKFEKVEDRVKYLRDNDTKALRAILYFCYQPDIKWLIPPTDPPFKPTGPEEDVQNVLKATYNKLRIYVKGGGYDNMNKTKREMQFINWLESLDSEDSKLVLSIRKKKIPYEGVTRHMCKKAFPEISKDW